MPYRCSSHPCESQFDHNTPLSTSLSLLYYFKSKSPFFFCPSTFCLVLYTKPPRKNSYFLPPSLGQRQPLSSLAFLLILQASPHSLSYYALRMGKPCKAVLILSFSSSLKTTSVVMPTNHSHMALIKQVIICDFFSAHLCSLYYYLIFLT